MRRRWFAAALVLALLAGACATPSGNEPSTASSRRTLTVMLADDWASSPPVVRAIAAFEEEHDVRVVTRPAKFGQLEEFMFADRDGPQDVDVAQWHAFAAGALGLAMPVTERFAATYDDDTFVPGAMEDVSWDGDVYGVPLDVNAVVLVVNTDLLARVGHTAEDLRTWDDVRTIAAAAAERGVRFTHLPASTWSTYAWLRANGGRWFEREPGSPTRLLLDSPPVLETFEFLTDLSEGERLAVVADDTDTDAEAYPLFFGEQLLALATGTWDVARLIEEDPGFAWEVVPMPLGPSADGPATVLGGSSLYVTGHADDPALAWEFATHLVEPEHALAYAREEGRLPARTDVLADPFFDDDRYRVAVEQLPVASAMPLIVYPRVLDLTTSAIFDVLNHLEDVPGAFGNAQRAGTSIVARVDERAS